MFFFLIFASWYCKLQYEHLKSQIAQLKEQFIRVSCRYTNNQKYINIFEYLKQNLHLGSLVMDS